MATGRIRGAWLIGVASALLLGAVTIVDLSPAEARMGGFHGGFRGGFGGGGFRGGSHAGFAPGFHGGFTHPSAFRHSVVSNRAFITNRAFARDRFFFHPFRRSAFFFNVRVGGFFPFYPVAYPYPAYYPNYYPDYSPCGYYDAYGAWVNAPCPPYDPSASAPYSAPY